MTDAKMAEERARARTKSPGPANGRLAPVDDAALPSAMGIVVKESAHPAGTVMDWAAGMAQLWAKMAELAREREAQAEEVSLSSPTPQHLEHRTSQ